MNNNLIRHKLLGILSEQYVYAENRNNESWGLSFNNIYKKLECNEKEFRIAIAELFENKEILSHDAKDGEGLMSPEAGLAAYSNKKYKKIYWLNIKNSVKDLIQIIIPVLSLLVAILAITLKIENLNKATRTQLQEVKQRIELLEKHTNMQQIESRTIHQNDTLNIE